MSLQTMSSFSGIADKNICGVVVGAGFSSDRVS